MAGSFTAAVRRFEGSLTVAGPPVDAFPLFSPEGERRWVPGWDPEPVHPAGPAWQEGQVFRTREAGGEAVWIVSRLDEAAGTATYHRIEPGRYVARIEVACEGPAAGPATVHVAYTFIGLSEAGNRQIEAMTEEEHDARLDRWAAWIRGSGR